MLCCDKTTGWRKRACQATERVDVSAYYVTSHVLLGTSHSVTCTRAVVVNRNILGILVSIRYQVNTG